MNEIRFPFLVQMIFKYKEITVGMFLFRADGQRVIDNFDFLIFIPADGFVFTKICFDR